MSQMPIGERLILWEELSVKRKLTVEEKYNKAYQNPEYMKVSVGQAYLTWVLTNLRFKSVLDVGCGCGYALLGFILHGKTAKGVEVCDYLLETTLRTYVVAGVVKKGRIQELPYEADTFDLVYCTDVLEHIPECDVHKSIGELVRVSRKYVFISVSTVPAQCMPSLKLHETVKPMEWWKGEFEKYRVKLVCEPSLCDGKVRRVDGFAALYEKY